MFHTEFKRLLTAAGFGDNGGQDRFRDYLEAKYGVKVTSQAVSAWCTGARVPRLSYLVAALDALAIHGQDRVRLIDLAAGKVPDSGNRPPEDDPTLIEDTPFGGAA